MKIRPKLIAALGAGVLAATTLTTAAAPASAAAAAPASMTFTGPASPDTVRPLTGCVAPPICGTILNNTDSYVKVCLAWNGAGDDETYPPARSKDDYCKPKNKDMTAYVRPHSSYGYPELKDIDAFYIPQGTTYIGGYRHRPGLPHPFMEWAHIRSGWWKFASDVIVEIDSAKQFCLFENKNFGGNSECHGLGKYNLSSKMNDRASSLYNSTDTTLCAFEHISSQNQGGYQLPVGPGHYFRDLTKDIAPDGHSWNDRISSIGYCRR